MKDNTIALVLLCLWIITSCQVKSDNANQNDNGKSELIINQEANQINLTTLKFINQTFDFGNVDKDTIIIAKYYFVNTGSKTLVIEFVNPDCSCTDYSVHYKYTEPGDKGYIELKLDTSDKNGQQFIVAVAKFNTEPAFYKLTLEGYVNDGGY